MARPSRSLNDRAPSVQSLGRVYGCSIPFDSSARKRGRCMRPHRGSPIRVTDGARRGPRAAATEADSLWAERRLAPGYLYRCRHR